MEKVVAVVDLKSFYASCECAVRHLDIFTTPLVCCDPYRSGSSVVMSVTPYLKKKYGIPNVCRKRDLPKVPGMIYAVPRMSYYLRMSAKVNSIFLDYVAEEDLHVYSVDESFLNLGPYLRYYNCTAIELVEKIKNDIWNKLGLVATAGIGPNMFLAKCALDNEGKKKEPYYAVWDTKDVPTKLWSIKSLTDVWGIGNGISSHLKKIGIHTMRDLATADISLLKNEFGIMGYQLHDLANGIDGADIEERYIPKERSLSNGQTLKRGYKPDEAIVVLREMNDELCYRLRKERQFAGKVSLYIGYENKPFMRQRVLDIATDDTDSLFESIMEAFEEGREELPIRGLYISFGKLTNPPAEQLSIFEKVELRDERRKLDNAIDTIKSMFGKNSVLRCSALTNSSTIIWRNGMIGGHKQ